MRKWRDWLPLAKIHKHDVPICTRQTPSTCEPFKKAFIISPLTHLERILNNPALIPKMYFGPGIVTYEKQEFWHGDLWQDSPIFGKHEISSDNKGW
jgi:hypothetical protein